MIRIQQITDPAWQIDGPSVKDSGNGRARVETGVLKVNNDWPGIFIRGDDACGYASELQDLLDSLRGMGDTGRRHAVVNLYNFADLLRACDVRKHKDARVLHGDPDIPRF